MVQRSLSAPQHRDQKQKQDYIDSASRVPIHVLVADSNQTQCQLLSSALRRQPDLEITTCRSEALDCLQALRSGPADILLLSDGPANRNLLIETLRSLHNHHPRLRLIFLLDSYDRVLS